MNTSQLSTYANYTLPKIFLGVVACLLGTYLVKEFITFPMLNYFLRSPAWIEGIQHLVSGAVLILIYAGVYRAIERRKLTELSLRGIVYDTVIGCLGGFGLISLAIFILNQMGYYEVLGLHSPSDIVLPLTTLVAAALLEELVFRGIIYRILENRFGTHIALLQAVVFGVIHLGNDNSTLTSVLFVILLGVVLSLLYTYTSRLWMPFFFHLSWNFAQIVYGTPLSGNDGFEPLVESTFEGPAFFIGTSFGMEDSFFSILFMAILAGVLYGLCRKNARLKPFRLHSSAGA